METSKVFSGLQGIDYSTGAVVSKTIIKKPTGTVTLFAFDKGEGLSEHTAPFDALVQILEGKVGITIGGNAIVLYAGESSHYASYGSACPKGFGAIQDDPDDDQKLIMARICKPSLA